MYSYAVFVIERRERRPIRNSSTPTETYARPPSSWPVLPQKTPLETAGFLLVPFFKANWKRFNQGGEG
jgi:hypothetical protein